MKNKMMLFNSFLLTFLFFNLKAQVISPELLGEWSFEIEYDLCQNTLENGCDMTGLTIEQYNNNTTLDTLLITEHKGPNESYSARYYMTVVGSDFYAFENLDYVDPIGAFDFMVNYNTDTLTNWTTMGIDRYFRFITSDSLTFNWSGNCGCSCGSEAHFSRIETTSNSTLISNSGAWSFYPNPAQEFITLEKAVTTYTKKTKISLIDSKGVIRKEIISSDFKTNLSLENLNAGLFYLRFEDEKEISIKKLIVVD